MEHNYDFDISNGEGEAELVMETICGYYSHTRYEGEAIKYHTFCWQAELENFIHFNLLESTEPVCSGKWSQWNFKAI